MAWHARCVEKSRGHSDAAAESWLLNTSGQQHHGDSFNADGGASGCGSCHWEYWVKPIRYTDIGPSSSWCFKCHAGTDGPSAGFVDPTQ